MEGDESRVGEKKGEGVGRGSGEGKTPELREAEESRPGPGRARSGLRGLAARSPGDRGAGEGRAGPQLRPVPAPAPSPGARPPPQRAHSRAAVKSRRRRPHGLLSDSRCLSPFGCLPARAKLNVTPLLPFSLA